MKEKIINYIKQNRVSTTEVADCLGKSGALEGVVPLNPHHFAVGEIQYLYAIQDSNWTVHEDLDREPAREKIVMIDALDVHGFRQLRDCMHGKNEGCAYIVKRELSHLVQWGISGGMF